MTRDTFHGTPDINREYSINYDRAALYTALPILLAFILYTSRQRNNAKITNWWNYDPLGTRDISEIAREQKSRTKETRESRV